MKIVSNGKRLPLRFASIFILFSFFLLPSSWAADMTWKTANQITVAWDPVTTLSDGTALPPGSVIQYQVYVRIDPAGTPVASGNPVAATQATVTFASEGRYDVGIKAQRLENGQVVSESDIAWSNDAAAAQGGKIFGAVYFKPPAAARNLRSP